jgi:nicotinamidase-related amidase
MTGMGNLFIDKSKTALVVIDLQKGVVRRQTAPYASGIVVRNAAALAESFRKNGMPVFLVRVARSPDGKDALRPIADVAMPAQTHPPDWAEIVAEIGPKPGDFVITKRQWGAFYGTELDLEFRRRGITTMVLCGIATNFGVESTARFAYEYGYHQVFAEDAMSAMSIEEHMFTITKTFPRIGLVKRTEEILAGL